MIRGHRKETGFILVSVLIICGLISTVAFALARHMQDDLLDMKIQADLVIAQNYADNGLVRAIAALSNPDDLLHAHLLEQGSTLLVNIDGIDIEVRAEPESGKADINASPLPLIENILQSLPGSAGRVQELMSRISEARRQDQFIQDLDVILSPADRFGDLPGQLRRNFTTLTGLSAPVEALAPEHVRAALERSALQGVKPNPRPIFTLRSRVKHSRLPSLIRKAVVGFPQLPAQRSSDYLLVEWQQDIEEW